MPDSTPIASVADISGGKAFARDAEGNLRELSVGDLLLKGEVLITANGVSVDLATIDGEFVTVADAAETAMTTDLVASLAAGNDESELTDESIDDVLNLLAGDGDILEGLEATAAGVSGGGGEGEGHSFIRLGRIVEELNPLGLALPADAQQQEEEETTGLDEVIPPVAPPGLVIIAASGSASEEGLAGGIEDSAGSPDTTDATSFTGAVTVVSTLSDDPLTFSLTAPTVPVTSGGATVVWTGNDPVAPTRIVGTVGVDGPEVATITINPDTGEYTFELLRPIDQSVNPIEDAQLLNFGVVATDGINTATTPLNINIEDDAPEATNDIVPETATNTPVTFDVRGNDKAGADGPDTGTLVVDSFTNPSNGGLTLNADGSFTYTPNDGYTGADSFTYQIKDADGDISEATVSLSVGNAPTMIDAVTGPGRVSEEGLAGGLGGIEAPNPLDTTDAKSVTGNVTASDPNTGDTLVYSLSAPATTVQSGGADVTWTATDATNTEFVGTVPGIGGGADVPVATMSIDQTGKYTFDLAKPFDQAAAGEDDLTLDFGVSVSDGVNPAATATISIGIEDDSPVAADDVVPATAFDTPTTFDVRVNDKAGGDGPNTGTLVVDSFTQPTNGTVALNGDGTFTYTPNGGYSGSDSFTYQIKDADGDISEAIVSLNVRDNINTPPDVIPATANVSEEGLAGGNSDTVGTPDTTDSAVAVGTVVATDADGDALTYGLTAPALDLSVKSGGETVTWAQTSDTLVTGSTINGPVATMSIDPTSGEYTFTLLKPFDHADPNAEDVLTLNFDVNVSDGVATTTESISIGIEDDSPITVAVNTDIAVDAVVDTYNLVFTIDRSGSMARSSGVDDGAGGTKTRLEVLQEAVAGTIKEYAEVGVVNIKFVTFSGVGESESIDWIAGEDAAISALEAITVNPGGYTSYDDAIETVMSTYANGLPAGADKTLFYFISDGKPQSTPDSKANFDINNEQGLDLAQTLAWQSFLADSNADASYAIGIPNFNGMQVNHLNNVAHVPGEADPFDAIPSSPTDVVAEDGVEVIDNTQPYDEELARILAEIFVVNNSVSTATSSGNLFAIGAVAFGADDGSITSVNDTVPVGSEITVDTAFGGRFVLNVDTGDYTFTVPVNLDNGGENVSISVNVTDNDGDQASVPLNFSLNFSRDSDAAIFSTLEGGDESDILIGSEFNNELLGGGGNDILTGGGGNDTLAGGLGADVFAWNLADAGTVATPAVDTVTDFDLAEDALDLSDLLQGNTDTGHIFVETVGADSVIHVSSTGSLNADGSGADQSIVVSGVDLVGTGADQSAIISDLISSGKLIADS